MEKDEKIICINTDGDDYLELFKIYTASIISNSDSEYVFLKIKDGYFKRYEQKNFITLLDSRKQKINKIKKNLHI